jgi:Pvc16 N-terminal domain
VPPRRDSSRCRTGPADGTLNLVISEVDSALRTLVEREAIGRGDVEVVFDAPTREWAGRRNSPTIDVYLYDIREDMRRRERGLLNEYDDRVRVIARHLPPRHFKLSYLVTAWTQRPEDEHRLLSALLSCFLRFDALPEDTLTGSLAELALPVPVTVALPPPEDRAFADVWSALGGELKPSIDLVVSAPVDTGQRYETGPPVMEPPRVRIGGSNGWPETEQAGSLGTRSSSDPEEPASDADRAAGDRVSMRRQRRKKSP